MNHLAALQATLKRINSNQIAALQADLERINRTTVMTMTIADKADTNEWITNNVGLD